MSLKRRCLILRWLISWSLLTHTMKLSRLTDLKDGTLWQRDGGGQQSGSGNLFSLCTCSHKRTGDHMTKLKSRWLKWDCINAPYAVSLHMFLYILHIYVVLYGAFLWILHFSYENQIKLIRHCRKTTLTECFLICKSKIKQKPPQTFTLLIITW